MKSKELAGRIISRINELAASIGRVISLMEVCGTHTVSLRRAGIHALLPSNIRLISGPGCPVCVTPAAYIENAVSLLENEEVRLVTFGDMLKVPAPSGRHLADYTAGGDVQIIYSPSELPQIAAESGRETVFLGIGFETTIPTILSPLKEARERGINNLSLLTAFKTVPPALKALLGDEKSLIDGFILPGHVSVITGEECYSFLEGRVPAVITGFEPLEMLLSIYHLLLQLSKGEAKVENCYPQAVSKRGNRRAWELMEEMLEPEDSIWRGLGRIKESGLSLKGEYSTFDAATRFALEPLTDDCEPEGCHCGEVIQGRLQPNECPLFGTGCTPAAPVGPCMVSSEGSCAAYYRYRM